jgi:hypothetical protein
MFGHFGYHATLGDLAMDPSKGRGFLKFSSSRLFHQLLQFLYRTKVIAQHAAPMFSISNIAEAFVQSYKVNARSWVMFQLPNRTNYSSIILCPSHRHLIAAPSHPDEVPGPSMGRKRPRSPSSHDPSYPPNTSTVLRSISFFPHADISNGKYDEFPKIFLFPFKVKLAEKLGLSIGPQLQSGPLFPLFEWFCLVNLRPAQFHEFLSQLRVVPRPNPPPPLVEAVTRIASSRKFFPGSSDFRLQELFRLPPSSKSSPAPYFRQRLHSTLRLIFSTSQYDAIGSPPLSPFMCYGLDTDHRSMESMERSLLHPDSVYLALGCGLTPLITYAIRLIILQFWYFQSHIHRRAHNLSHHHSKLKQYYLASYWFRCWVSECMYPLYLDHALNPDLGNFLHVPVEYDRNMEIEEVTGDMLDLFQDISFVLKPIQSLV